MAAPSRRASRDLGDRLRHLFAYTDLSDPNEVFELKAKLTAWIDEFGLDEVGLAVAAIGIGVPEQLEMLQRLDAASSFARRILTERLFAGFYLADLTAGAP